MAPGSVNSTNIEAILEGRYKTVPQEERSLHTMGAILLAIGYELTRDRSLPSIKSTPKNAEIPTLPSNVGLIRFAVPYEIEPGTGTIEQGKMLMRLGLGMILRTRMQGTCHHTTFPSVYCLPHQVSWTLPPQEFLDMQRNMVNA